MNVVHIPRRFTESAWGGTESTVLSYCKHQRALGWQSEIVTTDAMASPGAGTVQGISVTRHPYVYPFWGLRSGARALMDRRGGNLFSFQLRRALLRRPALDLLHLHTQKRLGGICRQVALTRGIPYLVSLHGGVLDVPPDECRRLVAPTAGTLEWGRALGMWVGSRRVIQDADLVLCVGRGELNRIRSAFPSVRSEYLPNGVDIDRFGSGDGPALRKRFGIPQDRLLVVEIARIDVQKNQVGLIRAIGEARARGTRCHLLLLGPVSNDSYARLVEAEIRRLGLERWVTVVPGLPPDDPGIADAHAAADIFALPSLHEPFGVAVLEAWAARKPVIVARRGGLPYFVDHGRTGWVIDPESAGELATAIVDLSSSPALRSGLARAGHAEVVRSYARHRIADKLSGFCEDLLHRRSRGAA